MRVGSFFPKIARSPGSSGIAPGGEKKTGTGFPCSPNDFILALRGSISDKRITVRLIKESVREDFFSLNIRRNGGESDWEGPSFNSILSVYPGRLAVKFLDNPIGWIGLKSFIGELNGVFGQFAVINDFVMERRMDIPDGFFEEFKSKLLDAQTRNRLIEGEGEKARLLIGGEDFLRAIEHIFKGEDLIEKLEMVPSNEKRGRIVAVNIFFRNLGQEIIALDSDLKLMFKGISWYNQERIPDYLLEQKNTLVSSRLAEYFGDPKKEERRHSTDILVRIDLKRVRKKLIPLLETRQAVLILPPVTLREFNADSLKGWAEEKILFTAKLPREKVKVKVEMGDKKALIMLTNLENVLLFEIEISDVAIVRFPDASLEMESIAKNTFHGIFGQAHKRMTKKSKKGEKIPLVPVNWVRFPEFNFSKLKERVLQG